MRKLITITAIFLGFHFVGKAQLLPNLGGQRAGISALTFLKIDPSARSAGMAGANLTLTGDVFASYWNPAGLAEEEQLSIGASNTFWAAGLNHAYISAINPFKFGHLGLSVTSLSTGAMERRTELQPNGTGEYFYASNTAVGLSYSKRLTDFFSLGANFKYVNETLAEFSAHTAVVDLGFLYRTDWKDLSFAVMMQSFGSNSRLRGNYDPDPLNPRDITLESYPAPTEFKLAVSMVPYKDDNKSLTTILQLNHPSDNAENLRLGLEFEYRDLLFVRGGYKINVDDQVYPTFGLGIRAMMGRHPLHFDYAVDPTRYLGWIHRIGVRFTLNKTNREEDTENVQ